MRVGAMVATLTVADAPPLEPDAITPAVIVGLDGGYGRSRHRRPERNFERHSPRRLLRRCCAA